MANSNVRRLAVAAVAAPALLMAAPAVAMADEATFEKTASAVGPDSVWFKKVSAMADSDGNTSFESFKLFASEKGVFTKSVSSSIEVDNGKDHHKK